MVPDQELLSVRIPRGLAERQSDARKQLESSFQMWLATGSDGRGAHLIPVAYVWDGLDVYTATFARSRTVANIEAHPQARIALGDTADVVMIDAGASLVDVPAIDADIAERYAQVSHDPRTYPTGTFLYLRLHPRRIQAWNGFHEFPGRTVMQERRWLDDPVD
jgi:general stress protein 26